MKTIIFLLIFNIYAVYSATPVIKIYDLKGNPSQYNIADISSLNFLTSNQSYSISIFQINSKEKKEFDIRTIDSITFTNNQIMNIFQTNNSSTFKIDEIDSVIFVLNICNIIQEGNQIWMCKNLDVECYRNGDTIPQIKDNKEWLSIQKGAWCYFNNDSVLGEIYGKIYNWYAVNDPRGLAPIGWHIPSQKEYYDLCKPFGNLDTAGAHLKEIGTSHWISPNDGATNLSGMSMLPGGYRSYGGEFFEIGFKGIWWTSDMNGVNADYILLCNNNKIIDFRYGIWWAGASVRCIKD
jgi:uncharacterized protein (TIGR02145 family)